MSGGVPLPGYQGMQQATPLDTMLSGKPYLQNRAQILRAARDYRRSGFNPQMAALLAQEQQAGNRGFMAQSELMNRWMANEANAQAMGYNQGLGDLNIKDRTRQDMVDAAGREAKFRDREYTDRRAMIDRLMGGDGSANPQAGMNDAMRYVAMDWMSPGLGRAMAEADGNRRGEPDARSQLQAAAMAASQGDPVRFRQLMQATDQTSGGAAAGGGADVTSLPYPKQDDAGRPVVDRQYIEGVLRTIPQGAPKSQIDKVLSQAGITVDDLSREYSAVSPGRFGIVPTWGEIARPYTGVMGGNFLLPGWRAMFGLGRDPQYVSAMANQEGAYRRELMRALGIGGGQPTNTIPSFTPR